MRARRHTLRRVEVVIGESKQRHVAQVAVGHEGLGRSRTGEKLDPGSFDGHLDQIRDEVQLLRRSPGDPLVKRAQEPARPVGGGRRGEGA